MQGCCRREAPCRSTRALVARWVRTIQALGKASPAPAPALQRHKLLAKETKEIKYQALKPWCFYSCA